MSNTKTIMGQASNQYVAPTDSSDLFSTFLYDGTGAAQTITNGVDLTKGGLVWVKHRDDTYDHMLADTETGVQKYLSSNATAGAAQNANALTSFNSNGFSIGSLGDYNNSGVPKGYVSWTFRKAPKFFDIVTWTGDGVAGRTISHNLGSVPGMIILKRTNSAASWYCYHRGVDSSAPEDFVLLLDGTNARINSSDAWNDTAPTDTVFTVGDNSNFNGSSDTYVAYLFAHNNGDGGFGPNSDQDIIKCGSYTGNGSSQEINIGFEPQWIMIKNTSNAADWVIFDEMRNFIVSKAGSMDSTKLSPNTRIAEQAMARMGPSPAGFMFDTENGSVVNTSGNTYIYMAIRRGPLTPPEAGTEVFAQDFLRSTAANAAGVQYYSGWPVDMSLFSGSISGGGNHDVRSRLTGVKRMFSNNTVAETSAGTPWSDTNKGWKPDSGGSLNTDALTWMWKRAPSFFDVVAYTGTGSNRTVSHNLTVAPEMMWVKGRDVVDHWHVYHTATTADNYLRLNDTGASTDSVTVWNDTDPTSSVFTVGNNGGVNGSGSNYIAYLFSSLAGVSKVGSYSGDSSASVNVDCGFTSGARFVLIKNSTSTGDWWVIDTVRGLTSSNDALIRLNSTAAEVTSVSRIDPYSSGFTVTNSDDPEFNRTGNTYIFYAIA